MKGAAAALGAVLSFGSLAPMQCKRDPDPADRIEDTAGDALWGLAKKFEDERNDASAKETLRYLVERYPSNRHVPEARSKLGSSANGDGG